MEKDSIVYAGWLQEYDPEVAALIVAIERERMELFLAEERCWGE